MIKCFPRLSFAPASANAEATVTLQQEITDRTETQNYRSARGVFGFIRGERE